MNKLQAREQWQTTTSPTFVARFSDGVVTRMTCHCTPGNLDLRRGIVPVPYCLSIADERQRTAADNRSSLSRAGWQNPS